MKISEMPYNQLIELYEKTLDELKSLRNRLAKLKMEMYPLSAEIKEKESLSDDLSDQMYASDLESSLATDRRYDGDP